MPEAVTLLVSQGPMGLVAGLFVYLFLQERSAAKKASADAAKELEEERKKYQDHLDRVRLSQIDREKEVATTLKEYGTSVLQSISHSEFLAKELRRVYGQRGQY